MKQKRCSKEDRMALFMFLAVASVAMFSFIAVATWSGERRKEREAYYRSETIKRVAELQGTGSQTAIEVLREEERIANRRRNEGQKLGGLVTLAVGIGLIVFLRPMMAAVHDPAPAYLVGFIPALIGLALLVYAYALAPKS
jgi:ferric-dicitrate binding protein FerR (iron transport regulator)